MKKGLIFKLLPHFIAVLIFLIVALIYCRPVLQGEVLQQSDIVQWKGMAHNSLEFKKTHGYLPLWTNSMFSGMPAYQIAMEPKIAVSPNIFYGIFTLFLPKPISFFFLACICFYFLSQVLRVNPYVGIIGALAYAYSTYNPVIVAVGHETKMQTIALLPAFIGSLILIYERKYWWGAALTALFTALMITFNHMQIVYYAMMIAFFMSVGYIIYWIKNKEFKHLLLSLSLAVVAGIVGIMCNSVSLATTYEYSKETIRGGSELADANSHSTKTGLSESYAFDYSMYKSEPFVMMVPKMFGGSDQMEISQEDSKAVEALQQMPPQLAQQLQGFIRFYWGGIGGTSGPPYVGAIICFLALIGFFILDSKHKWWILAGSIIAIIMSWGAYFAGFNGILLKVLPMYNKFRAPSMIIVIPTFLFCMMAILTLQRIISAGNRQELWLKYKKGLMLTGGVFTLLLLLYFSFDYTSQQETGVINQVPDQIKEYVRSLFNALKEDRRSLFLGSLVRSFLFIAAAAFILWLTIQKKIKVNLALAIVGVLTFIDLISVDSKYLSSDNYQEESEYQNNFVATPADQQIMQDKSFYRVLDLRQGIQGAFNAGAMTAYFHNSIGGYHPAKLSIYQDLIEHQLYNFPNCLPVINMLNTKYVIQPDQSGKETVITNPEALGNAWFVKAVRFENTPAAVMNALTNFHPKDTAIVFNKDKDRVTNTSSDTSGVIKLVKNDNDIINYTASSQTGGFAVFSEVYYDKGWKAYIDNKESPIIRTNYVLRGLNIPAGNHDIRFEFKPASFYTGEKIASFGGILIYLALLIAAFHSYRSSKVEKEKRVVKEQNV